jgi:predicted acylesterase/phospholipase RssA
MNDISSNTIENEPDTIKHMAIGGGGHYGLTMYGIIKDAHNKGFWKYENIKSLYGTSIGSVVCLLVVLDYDWDILDRYFIERPWETVFNFDLNTIIYAFDNRGLFDQTIMDELMTPLLLGKDIPINITLKELYDRTGIDLYITVSEIVQFELNVLSHKTHPEWRVLDAIYASCSLPVIFAPIIKNNCCYIDGGLFSNYPLDICIRDGCNPDEVFGIRKTSMNSREPIDTKSSLFDIIKNVIRNATKSFNRIPFNSIKNEVNIQASHLTFEGIIRFSTSKEERIKLIDDGCNLFAEFYKDKDKDKL